MSQLTERTVTLMGPPASPDVGGWIPRGIGASSEQLYGPGSFSEVVPKARYIPRSGSTVTLLSVELVPLTEAQADATIPLGLGAAPFTAQGPLSAQGALLTPVEVAMAVPPDFGIKQDSLFPPLTALLQDVNGPYDLTDCAVRLILANRSTRAVVVNAPAEIVPDQVAYKGQVIYHWAPADVASPGAFVAEFLVTSASGVPLRFPSGGAFTVAITKKAGP